MLAPVTRATAVTRTGLRAVAVVAGLVVLGGLHLRTRPATVCPLRALTGVPCPFCGGTTAAADLGRGRFLAALRSSPLAVGLLAWLPFAATTGRPSWWARAAVRRSVVAAVLIAAELWQVQRFHVFTT
jgi:Protein of unknown function (DUF2752)